jgi:hypothetical protein
MSYVPNAQDPSEPVESRSVESAALEFRTLKAASASYLRVPEASVPLAPAVADRAGKVLGFDASGSPVAVAVSGSSDPSLRADLAAPAGSSLVGFQQAGTGAVSRTVQSKLREFVSVKDFGAIGNGVADDTAAIQAALDAHLSVTIPPTSGFYKISAPLVLRDNAVLHMEGVVLVSTAAGIFRFPSGGTAAIYAANSVMQTNTAAAGAAISIVSGASAVTGAFIYGFPMIIAANAIVDAAFRGIDMSGFYRSYLEVHVSGFYYGVYGDGDNGGTFATYYNVLMKPDIRCGQQGYAIYLTNLVNATTIISPFINGGDIGYGGIFLDNNSGANNVVGGYAESFAAHASSVGIVVLDSPGNTFTGMTLDQGVGDVSANYAVKVLGASAGNSFVNLQFAGAWNDTSKMLLNTTSGKNTFIGNGYTNAFVFGLTGVGIATEGSFVNELTAYDDVVIGTAGKGVDFTATTNAAGMTSELFDDYEEGTWEPNQGAGLTLSGAFSSSGAYTKVGRQVTVTAQLNGAVSIACSAGGVLCSNLPFSATIDASGTRHNVDLADGGVVYASGASVYAIGAAASTTRIYFTVTYFVPT